MAPDGTKTHVDEESYYVIVLRFMVSRRDPKTKQVEYVPEFHYYKSNRYTLYSGCLQTEYDIELAKHWKTEDGAVHALARLRNAGTIKSKHEPVVCKYTKTVTRNESLVSV